jgi:hypothetical protein
MPVLILALASYFVFFMILLLLWVAGKLEARELRRKAVLPLHNPIPLLSITQAFDPVYAVVWEAPIAAMRLAASRGTPGVPASKLRPLFRRTARRFPEIYDGCTFAQWLAFLEQTGLIASDGHRVFLTAEGESFLKYWFVSDTMLHA